MSNTVNPFDFAAETLAQFLAKTISDGTFADVAEALKVDQPGQEADATDIIVAAGELWSNMVDDFVLAAYPLLRTVATGGGGGGSRLAINPTPTIGGPPTARTYTAILNEAITFGDGGGPPSTLVLTLPDIATASPGDQIGLLLTDGNPSFAITFQQTPADLINDPATGFNTGPPGTPLVIAAGTYASAVWLVWEAVQSAGFPSAATWTYIGDRGGGGGGETYAQTLALGQDSGALGPYLNDPQRRVMGSDLAASPSPGVFTSSLEGYQYEGSHEATLTAGSGEAAGTYVLDPVDIMRNSNLTIGSGTAFVEWWAYRFASSDGISFPVLRGYATAIETWTIGTSTALVGAQRVPDVETFSGFDCVRVAVGSTLRSLAFEVLEAPAGGLDMTVRLFYKITYVQNAPGS
jgi:hypothetical protein